MAAGFDEESLALLHAGRAVMMQGILAHLKTPNGKTKRGVLMVGAGASAGNLLFVEQAVDSLDSQQQLQGQESPRTKEEFAQLFAQPNAGVGKMLRSVSSLFVC